MRFSGKLENQDDGPCLWLAETFSTSLEPLNRIRLNFKVSMFSIYSTRFVFFVPIGKPRWPPRHLICWDIFRLLLCKCWTEFNQIWWGRHGLRRFQLFLCNRWTEFNETWQETRWQCPLPSVSFSGRFENQDDCPYLWLTDTFSTSSLDRWIKFDEIYRKQVHNTLADPSTIDLKSGTLYSGARYLALLFLFC